MNRRQFLPVFAFAAVRVAAAAPIGPLRGKLGAGPDGAPTLETPNGPVRLSADDPTVLVLRDPRLVGTDFEVMGRFAEPGRFQIEPIHTRSLFVHKGGQRLLVTFWCGVCYIRTYSPGQCWCCQDDTELDLKDPATLETEKK